jgi:hypothetical protein
MLRKRLFKWIQYRDTTRLPRVKIGQQWQPLVHRDAAGTIAGATPEARGVNVSPIPGTPYAMIDPGWFLHSSVSSVVPRPPKWMSTQRKQVSTMTLVLAKLFVLEVLGVIKSVVRII